MENERLCGRASERVRMDGEKGGREENKGGTLFTPSFKRA